MGTGFPKRSTAKQRAKVISDSTKNGKTLVHANTTAMQFDLRRRFRLTNEYPHGAMTRRTRAAALLGRVWCSSASIPVGNVLRSRQSWDIRPMPTRAAEERGPLPPVSDIAADAALSEAVER